MGMDSLEGQLVFLGSYTIFTGNRCQICENRYKSCGEDISVSESQIPVEGLIKMDFRVELIG